jgi:hypothetical protein
MLIFPSQPEDLGEGMEAKKILVPAHPRAGKIDTWVPAELWLDPGLLPKDKKKMNHQKNSGQCKIRMDKHSNYSPMSNEGRAIVFVLILENLHRTAIWRERSTRVKIRTGKSKENKEHWYAHLGAWYLWLEYLDKYSEDRASW